MKAILLSSLSFSVLALMVLAFRRFRGGDKYSRRLARALWIVGRPAYGDSRHAVGQPGGDPFA